MDDETFQKIIREANDIAINEDFTDLVEMFPGWEFRDWGQYELLAFLPGFPSFIMIKKKDGKRTVSTKHADPQMVIRLIEWLDKEEDSGLTAKQVSHFKKLVREEKFDHNIKANVFTCLHYVKVNR